jgi:hypothetical protein
VSTMATSLSRRAASIATLLVFGVLCAPAGNGNVRTYREWKAHLAWIFDHDACQGQSGGGICVVEGNVAFTSCDIYNNTADDVRATPLAPLNRPIDPPLR